MAHPYPPHRSDFSYVGEYNYALNFTTFEGTPFLTEAAAVDLVRWQILRASVEQAMELTAYCFMPDHVHLIVRGMAETFGLPEIHLACGSSTPGSPSSARVGLPLHRIRAVFPS